MPGQDEQMSQGAMPEVLAQFSVVNRVEKQGARIQQETYGDATDLISATKALRVSIDASIKEAQTVAKMINRGNGGREVALSITKLQEAKMWAGKALEEYGHPLPAYYRDEAK